MKSTGIINGRLSELLAGLRHTQAFVVTDSGFPLPARVEVVDLAVVYGVPRLSDVLDAILAEVVVQDCVIAVETAVHNPGQSTYLASVLPRAEAVSHADLKRLAAEEARFAIRTGECTPYSNVLMRAGWPFDS
jgi:D-ribose pyranase